jgi:hypothetical protein
VIEEAKRDFLLIVYQYLPKFPDIDSSKAKKEKQNDEKLKAAMLERIEEINRDIRRANYQLAPEQEQEEISFK